MATAANISFGLNIKCMAAQYEYSMIVVGIAFCVTFFCSQMLCPVCTRIRRGRLGTTACKTVDIMMGNKISMQTFVVQYGPAQDKNTRTGGKFGSMESYAWSGWGIGRKRTNQETWRTNKTIWFVVSCVECNIFSAKAITSVRNTTLYVSVTHIDEEDRLRMIPFFTIPFWKYSNMLSFSQCYRQTGVTTIF